MATSTSIPYVDVSGNLKLTRGKEKKQQYCMYSQETKCSDRCPKFGNWETNGVDSSTQKNKRTITICDVTYDVGIADISLFDERGYAADTTAPGVPTNASETVTGSNVAFSWTPSTDNVMTTGYNFRYGTTSDLSEATATALTAASHSLTSVADGVHYWQVQAVDKAGNKSAWTEAKSFTVDVTAPSVPANLAETVTGANVAFTWDVSTDNVALAGYDFRYGTTSDLSEATPTALTTNSHSLESLSAGTYYWQVRAVDAKGNTSAWASAESFVVE